MFLLFNFEVFGLEISAVIEKKCQICCFAIQEISFSSYTAVFFGILHSTKRNLHRFLFSELVKMD